MPYCAPSVSPSVVVRSCSAASTTAGSSAAGPAMSSPPPSSSLLRTAIETPPTSSGGDSIGTTTNSQPGTRRGAGCAAVRAERPHAAQLGPELGRRRRHLRADVGDVGVGQVAVGGLQAQAVGEAAAPLPHAGAAVHVEQVEVDEQRAGALADRLVELLGRHVVGEREREVEVARRVTARRLPRRRLRLLTEHGIEVELEHGDALGDVERLEHVGGDLADGADHVAAGDERRRAGGVQAGAARGPGRCARRRPVAAAISRHTATAAGASSPASTTPSASCSAGSSPGPGG